MFIELYGDQQTYFKNIPKVVLINHSIYVKWIHDQNWFAYLNHYVRHVQEVLTGIFLTMSKMRLLRVISRKKNIVPVLLVYTRPELQATKEMLIPKSLDLEILSNFHTLVYEAEHFN